jgi:membrane protease YdiL (CAAX protease family)
MKGLVGDLRAELRDFRGREWFLALGTLLLVVLWLYLGSPAFFVRTWGTALRDAPLLDWYRFLYYHVNALVLLGIVPLAVMRGGFGVRPAALGIRVGDARWGLRFVLVGMVVVTPVIYASSFDPAFQREYPLTKLAGQSVTTWVLWELTYLLYYLGWEAYFRGTLLFGLRERLGAAGALAFQTAISTLVHLGKPLGETLGAAPAGFLLGAAALRSGSVLWPLLLHWYLGALMDVLSFRHAAGLLP